MAKKIKKATPKKAAPKQTKQVDLSHELYVHVDGEVAKNHTLPWSVLKSLGDSLEDLLLTIARNSLPESDVVKLENFKLEFAGFFPGSAVPAFALNTHTPPTLFDDKLTVAAVSKEFSEIMSHSESGNFQAIADKYNEPLLKNEILKKVSRFTNSTGDSPIQIVKRSKTPGKFIKIFAPRKLRPDLLSQLVVTEEVARRGSDIALIGVATVEVKKTRTGKNKVKPLQIYSAKENVITMEFTEIDSGWKIYKLNHPVFFRVIKEGKGVIIENEQLDLYAAAANQEEAAILLFERFDHTYNWINQFEDKALSKRMLRVKQSYNLIVNQVIEKNGNPTSKEDNFKS